MIALGKKNNFFNKIIFGRKQATMIFVMCQLFTTWIMFCFFFLVNHITGLFETPTFRADSHRFAWFSFRQRKCRSSQLCLTKVRSRAQTLRGRMSFTLSVLQVDKLPDRMSSSLFHLNPLIGSSVRRVHREESI